MTACYSLLKENAVHQMIKFRTDNNSFVCVFNKKFENTSLRIFYGGNFGIHACHQCCKRWYFTLDGAEDRGYR